MNGIVKEWIVEINFSKGSYCKEWIKLGNLMDWMKFFEYEESKKEVTESDFDFEYFRWLIIING